MSLHSLRVITHTDDEVNIAQFHPHPGYGFVYGTKSGHIRLYLRGDAPSSASSKK
jgi:activating molecule in BECN1-regulated autophagy protein 1